MSSSCTARAFVSRLSNRSPSLGFKLNKTSTATFSSSSPLKPSQISVSSRISMDSRLSLGLRSLVSMLPLYSAIASARLNSILSMESQNWGMVPLGLSMPL
ncbi:hypothetical protein AQUCO_00100417v1 [Aquilegia coerulea]|uniref:Uncharacterized protein n=1 Tax=Aquilegia coerulea TaxID=218851 RepID=A0A2G5FAE8_AQUCA|nr:hypothetical protein AQUCO_00100417v1 [Aquilegia coerulea]